MQQIVETWMKKFSNFNDVIIYKLWVLIKSEQQWTNDNQTGILQILQMINLILQSRVSYSVFDLLWR